MSNNVLPQNINQWQNFLSDIDKVYNDFDDERYIVERSMKLSSQEIFDLNLNLERAQHIAGLGYWTISTDTGEISWSKELSDIVHVYTNVEKPNLEQTFAMIHPNDRNMFAAIIEKARTSMEQFTVDLRLIALDGTCHWFHTVGAQVDENKAPYNPISGISMDITLRKQNEFDIASLNQQILSSAKAAGVAEIVTTVLHNIGNILTSMTVSSNLLIESYMSTNYQLFADICKLFNEHESDLAEYLKHDQKGMLLPAMLNALSEDMLSRYYTTKEELAIINDGIKNIKEILLTQQEFAIVGGASEHLDLKDVMENTLKIFSMLICKDSITLTQEYNDILKVWVDKAKLIHVLLNVLKNARESLMFGESNQTTKTINISIQASKNQQGMAEILISDNGAGIRSEDLKKLFNYGFTTKKTGHGFGLHSCALYISELGGMISVSSPGPGKGATFTILIPLEASNTITSST